ncbi:TetR family transcriptional regulator [Microbacterium sp. LMI13-1-1.1]|uniref:TetR family transcriptional regulator n=1 Tax=Microbacterium sp. LMI13-1-1.1 TaxID=3135226 RepID=UPI0034659A7E
MSVSDARVALDLWDGRTSFAGIRGVARDAVRDHVAQVGIDLFAERGFDAVTVEEIAANVGISARSFHRYFPTKEDSVIGETRVGGELVTDAFAARPLDETVWESLAAAFGALLDSTGTEVSRGSDVCG